MTGSASSDPVAEKVRASVSNGVNALLKNSLFLEQEKQEHLPHFRMEEMNRGKRLGSGAFGTVWEIAKVSLSDSPDGESPERRNSMLGDDDDGDDLDGDDARKFVSAHCVREKTGDARYAIKILNDDVVSDPNLFEKGSLDLAMEAEFLSNIEHPNIIKVRGAAVHDLIGTKDYFIVMDRLYDTLENRMDSWKVRNKKLSGFMAKKQLKKEFVQERLHVAFELSAAFSYIHAKNVIYRDLKPENLGFDIRGDIKIFDFGFAKELTPNMSTGIEEDSGMEVFHLTAKCGTLIYMAPEVVLGKPYNLKADVYSFAILLWEFFALKEPFPKCTASIHEKMVCRGSTRPKIEKKWPEAVRSTIEGCWAKQMGKRPVMKGVNLNLKREVQKMRGGDGDDGNMDFTKRRSTFVFRGK